MVGPSAIGSENGTPSSMMSAPASTSACISGTVVLGSGSPAVMNRISALRSAALSRWNVDAMRDMSFPGLLSERDAGVLGDGVHVLVAATREIHQQHLVAAHRRS